LIEDGGSRAVIEIDIEIEKVEMEIDIEMGARR
jgi:hypothetical protein